MRYQEILEACWTGYRQAGMKKKGDRRVPNCVPVAEVKIGPDMTLNDLLYTAAAKAMHQAGLEGIPMDYEEAIKKAAKIYKIPYTSSELPKLLAQRAEIDRKLAMLKQGKQVAKARRKEKLAPTPAGAEEYWKTHALPTDRIKPPAKTLEETEAELAEDLKKWFREKWVRFGPDGKIRGDCARGSSKEGKPKCLPQSKAHALGKKGRASAAAKKRREDPNPERRGPARNVATKVKEDSNPKFAGLIKNIQARMKKDDYQRPELMKRVAQMVQQADPTVQDSMITAQQLVQQYGQGPAVKQTNVWDLKAQARSGNLAAQLPKTSAGTPSYAQQHATFEEQSTNDDDWYDDADEFGMPGSEFFPDDDRLRDGDYVRDRQDGEYGEIFRMSGDPSERRVRILDRDGKGWYISPERLVAVDRTDPDIMKYFGKRRNRDMDEGAVADALQNYLQVAGENDVDAVKSAIQKIARDASLKPTAKARLLGQVGMMIKTHKLPVGREYYQYMQQFMEQELDEGWKQNVAAGILGATMALSPVPARAEIANMSPVQVQQSIKRAELAEKYAEVLIQRAKEDGRPIDTRMMNAIKAKASDMAAAQIQKQNAGQQTQQQNFPKQGSERMVSPNFDKFESKQELDEKQDACYRKVKSRYKVWPSAYASGALVQCRKKGAANWGNKTKKE